MFPDLEDRGGTCRGICDDVPACIPCWGTFPRQWKPWFGLDCDWMLLIHDGQVRQPATAHSWQEARRDIRNTPHLGDRTFRSTIPVNPSSRLRQPCHYESSSRRKLVRDSAPASLPTRAPTSDEEQITDSDSLRRPLVRSSEKARHGSSHAGHGRDGGPFLQLRRFRGADARIEGLDFGVRDRGHLVIVGLARRCLHSTTEWAYNRVGLQTSRSSTEMVGVS